MAGTLPDPVDFGRGEVRLGPYRLLRPISAGGMARVYEGRLDSLAGVTTRVAIKVIHPDFASEAAFQELFITEARISARLEHQNLVRIQQFNREGHLYYLVMEYIEGVTFRKIISLRRKHRLELPVQVVAELGRQVCEGLHYAHNLVTEQGEPLHLVHRDIKPSNLMLNAHGVAKVLDFGISSAMDTGDTPGAVKGTWGYMALEQAEGGLVGPAADVFGLGAVLYELAALEPLFAEKENALIRQRLYEDAAAARAAALGGPWSELGGVLVRALQRDPEARHRSAATFGRALSTLVVDPVGVHESLVRLYRDLRAAEGATGPGVQEKPRTAPTMSRAGIGSPRIEPPPKLPVRFGDGHGPRPSPSRATRPGSSGPLKATLAAGALLLVALGVLGFAAWQLVAGPPKPVPVATAPPSAPADSPLRALVGDEGSTPVQVAPDHPAADAEHTPSPVAPAPVASTTEPTRHASEPRPATPAKPHPVATRPPEEPPPPAPKPEPEAPPQPPVVDPVDPAAPVRIAPKAVAQGMLTVSSMPRAQVMVDGQYVRYTPIYQYAVSEGTHTVVLVAEDGRRKTFKVEVAADAETRKIWLFDEERFQ